MYSWEQARKRFMPSYLLVRRDIPESPWNLSLFPGNPGNLSLYPALRHTIIL